MARKSFMFNHPNIEIIAYDDRYARDAVRMWRDSKEKALRQKDIHGFNDHRVVGILAINGSRLNQLYIHINYQKIGLGSRLLNPAKELSPGTLELFTFEVSKKARVLKINSLP